MYAGITCWPMTPTVRANGIFVVEFYGYSQRLVEKINSKYPIYLKSEREKIPLVVQEVCKGEFQLTQIILRPSKTLTGGTYYELHIDSLQGEESVPGHWNKETKKFEPMRWKVMADSDLLIPEWKGLPFYQTKSFAAYGCGPARIVNFSFFASDQSQVLVRTTVTSLSTKKQTIYYLIPEKDKVKVGHGMCAGGFHFEGGKEYEVVFELMDASGNYGCEKTKPIRFTRPESEK